MTTTTNTTAAGMGTPSSMNRVTKSVLFLTRLKEKTSARLLGAEEREQNERLLAERHRRDVMEMVAKVALVVVYTLIAIVLVTMLAKKMGES